MPKPHLLFLVLAALLAGCTLDAAEADPLPLAEGLYVFELSDADQAELDAAKAAMEATPDDEDLRSAYNRVHGRTWRALEIAPDGLFVIGQGRRLTVDETAVTLQRLDDDTVRLDWLDGGVIARKEVVR